MCVHIYLGGVAFGLSCPGVLRYLSMLCLCGEWRLWFMWDRQSLFQQNPVPSPEDYRPVILRGKGCIMYCGWNPRGSADLLW